MKLYYSPQTRAFPILWALEELNVKCELEVLDLQGGDQRRASYRRINPMMKVPALVDDKTIVTETGAVLQYIAERRSPSRLLPPIGDPTRAACLRWLFFVGSSFEPAMGEKFNGWTPNPYYNGWGDFERVRDVVGEALSAGPWLVGGTFTIADIYLASDLRIARRGDLITADDEPFRGYLERIEGRPAFRRAEEFDSKAAQGV